MAYNYLDLTNRVLSRMNEVTLTSGGFASARGFQVQCKDAVNDAINFINQREFQWPFNHSSGSATLVAGTTRYTFPSDMKVVNLDSFRIAKNASLNTDGRALQIMDYAEYLDKYVEQEDDTTVEGGVPEYIVFTPDNNFLLYPYPDKAYTLRYDYFTEPTELSTWSDVPTIPENYKAIIADGATAYAYQYRGEKDQYELNFRRFEKGITQMQTLLINKQSYVRSTVK